jgi:flagellar protein FliO/FliZ
MVLVLLAVCALAYALLRWGLRRFQATSTSRAHGMRVLARLSLEPRRSVYVVEIAGRYFVLGTAEGGLSTLAELDAETAARIERAPAAQRSTFREILLGKKK